MRNAQAKRLGDPIAEPRAAEDVIAIGGVAGGAEQIGIQQIGIQQIGIRGLVEQRAIGDPASAWLSPERQHLRMRCEQRRGRPARMRRVARPWVIQRIGDHAGVDRVAFDGAMAGEDIALVLRDAGAEAPVPQGAPPAMHLVEPAHMAAPQALHELRQAGRFVRRHQRCTWFVIRTYACSAQP